MIAPEPPEAPDTFYDDIDAAIAAGRGSVGVDQGLLGLVLLLRLRIEEVEKRLAAREGDVHTRETRIAPRPPKT